MGNCADVCGNEPKDCIVSEREISNATGRFEQVFKQNYLYTCGNEGSINQYSQINEKINLVKPFGQIKKGIQCFAVTPNWKYFFIAGENGFLCQFSVDNQTLVKDYGTIHNPSCDHLETCCNIKFMISTLDSKYLFISDDTGQLTQIDVEAMLVFKNFGRIHQGGIYSMAITTDYQFTSSEFGILRQYNIASQKLFKDYKKVHQGSIYSIVLHDKHNILFVSNDKGDLKQLSLSEMTDAEAKPAIYDNGNLVNSAIMSMKITPDLDNIFINTENGNLSQWLLEKDAKFNYFKMQHLKDFKLSVHFSVDSFDFSTDSRLLYTADRKKNLKIWDIENGTCIDETLSEIHRGRVWTIKIIPTIEPKLVK